MEPKTDKVVVIMCGFAMGLIVLFWAIYLFTSERRQGRFEQKLLEEARLQTALMGKDHQA